MWLVVLTFLCNKLNFSVFFSHEKKIWQILESLTRKWNALERNGLTTVATWLKQRESITQNSGLITKKCQISADRYSAHLLHIALHDIDLDLDLRLCRLGKVGLGEAVGCHL